MIAGFERRVQHGALGGGTRALQSPDLRMFLTGACVPALTHYRAVAHHDRSHQRVRRRSVAPVLCELTGALHKSVPSHSFLSPIRTLTVGAGLQPCFKPSPAQPPSFTSEVRGLSGERK